MQLRMQRAQEWDVQPPNPMDRTFDSEPVLIDSVIGDEEMQMLPSSIIQPSEPSEDLYRSDKSIQGFEDF